MTNSPKNDTDQAGLECMKHHVTMDAAFPQCRDPELYCKFRTSCIIHFMEKENARSRLKRIK
jgi:hypothetical protein